VPLPLSHIHTHTRTPAACSRVEAAEVEYWLQTLCYAASPERPSATSAPGAAGGSQRQHQQQQQQGQQPGQQPVALQQWERLSREQLEALPVRELKQRLAAAGVDSSGCVGKEELVDLLQAYRSPLGFAVQGCAGAAHLAPFVPSHCRSPASNCRWMPPSPTPMH